MLLTFPTYDFAPMAFCEQDMEMNKMSPDFIFCVPLKLPFLIAFLRHPKSDLNA